MVALGGVCGGEEGQGLGCKKSERSVDPMRWVVS